MRRAIVVFCLLACWCVPAWAEITVVGPAEPINAGDYAFLQVTGLSQADLVKASVTVTPTGPLLMPLQDWSGKPMLFFSSRKEGSFTVSVSLNAWSQIVDDGYQVVKTAPIAPADEELRKSYLNSSAALTAAYRPDIGSCTITVGDGEPPPPPPPPPDEKKQYVFFVETADLDNLPKAQRDMLASLTLRDELAAKGHKFLGQWDDDTQPTANQQAWYDAIQGDPMPRIAVAPVNGGSIVDYPLPANAAELRKLLGGGS